MNGSIFWRLVWKEYRLQRDLWISMFVLTVLLMLLFFASTRPPEQTVLLFWTAAGLPSCCLLGCGAVLFAGEREAGTYELQRSLPVAATWVFAAKIVFVLLATAIMFSLSGLLAFFLASRTQHCRRGSARGPLYHVGILRAGDVFVGHAVFALNAASARGRHFGRDRRLALRATAWSISCTRCP